jgi:hypothetical protein
LRSQLGSKVLKAPEMGVSIIVDNWQNVHTRECGGVVRI